MLSKITTTALLLAMSGCAQPDQGADRLGTDDTKADQYQGELAFEDADLQCFNGEIEIGIYAGAGFVEESIYGMGDLQPNASNVVKIRVPSDRTYELSKNTIFTTDGAGNDTAQVLYLDGNEIVPVLHFYYDHEEGFLRGHYALPNYKTFERDGSSFELIHGFGDSTSLTEAMNCYDYTFGDA